MGKYAHIIYDEYRKGHLVFVNVNKLSVFRCLEEPQKNNNMTKEWSENIRRNTSLHILYGRHIPFDDIYNWVVLSWKQTEQQTTERAHTHSRNYYIFAAGKQRTHIMYSYI